MSQINEKKLISVEDFANLSNDKQIKYLMKQYNLKGPFLIGTVLNQSRNSQHLIIRNLKNPYNGEIIKKQLFSDLHTEPDNAIFYSTRLKEVKLKPGHLILFRFRSTNIFENIEKGDVLVGIKGSIQILESTEEALDTQDISEEELLNIQLETGFDKIGYVSDLYRTNVKAIFDQRAENILRSKEELEERKAELENEKAELKKEEEALLIKQLKFDEHVADQNAKLEKINEKVMELGFPPLDDTEHAPVHQDEPESISPLPESDQAIVTAIHEQINLRGLDYDKATIRQFYSALKTNQFTILSGPSGTGKTSLISAFAEVTSSLAKVIPVQPSWTDKQDLLGYYNPLDKQYVPSQLLDAMIEAKANQDKLYLICLDELNLAQIEYYFADILSLREQRGVPLELYTKYEYDQNIEEIEWFLQKSLHEKTDENELELHKFIEDELKIPTIDQYRYVQRYKNLQRYNWSINIPKNVRFIGTMNIDGSVRPLSPKVVDRSFIIPLERQKYDGEIAEDELIFDLSYEAFAQKPERNPDNELKANLQNTLSNDLQMLEANFNTRVDNHLDDYIAIAQQFDVAEQIIYDELILLKLLPRIEKLIDHNIDVTAFLANVEKLCGKNAASVAKINTMIKKSDQTKIFSYWS